MMRRSKFFIPSGKTEFVSWDNS